jgi:hypothetical protein
MRNTYVVELSELDGTSTLLELDVVVVFVVILHEASVQVHPFCVDCLT